MTESLVVFSVTQTENLYAFVTLGDQGRERGSNQTNITVRERGVRKDVEGFRVV